MSVTNRVNACKLVNPANKKILPRAALTHLVVHRTDLDTLDPVANPHPVTNALLDGVGLAERFANVGLGTGGCIPYHFLVKVDGEVEQILPLAIRGAHAIGYNWRSIGVAAVGDFRKYPMPTWQYGALVSVLATLSPLNGGLILAGHSALPGAVGDSRKVCPGEHVAIDRLLAAVTAHLPLDYRTWNAAHQDFVLSAAGVVV